MREIIFISLIVLLVGISFSDIGNSTYNLLTNCTTAANNGIGDYHTWVDCLNRTSFVLNGSYNYGSKGILFLRGYSTYTFEVYNGSKQLYSNSTKQIVYILPIGNYTVKVSSNGYISQTKDYKLTPGEFIYTYFELEKNTTSNKTSTSGSGGGIPSNTFVDISNSYVKAELESLKDELNLTDEQIQYQEKVLDYTKVHVKYYLFTMNNANTLYYYIYNNWNKTINVTVVVDIPKEVSKDLNGVSLRTGYKIIKSDPIVSWNFNIGSGKSAYVSYTVTNENITTVVPPALIFHNVELPKSNNQVVNQNSSNNSSNNLISSNVTEKTNETENNQSNAIMNNTVINSSKKKSNDELLWILIVIAIIVGIMGIYFYFFRRKPHQVIEKSLNQIERFTG